MPTEKAQARSDRSVDPFTQTDPAPVKDLDPFREISVLRVAVKTKHKNDAENAVLAIAVVNTLCKERKQIEGK